MEPGLVFTKKLTKTDVNHRLSFPTEHLEILPPFDDNAVEFQVSCEDRVRTFCCIKRRNGFLKPTIERGWSDLVEDKGVQIGDKVQFYMEASDDGAPRYWIKIYRYEDHDDGIGTTRYIHRIA